ncbi:hypothetical protein DL96DRAFT_872830 [Flagelloscypha sp. PMI_526]|nr:hypothetical protein DL96DRAFT_872830 [Flagelloscypha sp. PMI_526]
MPSTQQNFMLASTIFILCLQGTKASSTDPVFVDVLAAEPQDPEAGRKLLHSVNQKVIAHGILCTIGYLFLLPLGALLGRYFRTFTDKWFKGHMVVQWFIAGPVILAGFALGIAAVKQGNTKSLDNHMKLGIVLFALYIMQLVVGSIIHWVKPRNPKGRPPQNYFHAVFGILIIALAFFQVRMGYKDEWTRIPMNVEPKGANTVWIVWIVLVPVAYVGGLAFLPKQYRQEREARESQGAQDETKEATS